MGAIMEGSSSHSSATGAASGAHEIACMEVWGGSKAFIGHVSVPGNDVAVSCVPYEGGRTGGDVYYVSSCAAGLITRFILADISGHGEQMATLAAQLRRLMRRYINSANQTALACGLNRAFAEVSTSGRFATAALLTYFAPTDHLIFCNAGHPRPLLWRSGAGRWMLLDASVPGTSGRGTAESAGIRNLPLGVLDPTDYEQIALKLDPGDVVVLYSDALIEAAAADGPQLGESGLLGFAEELAEEERADIGGALRRRVAGYTKGRELNDDSTLVVLHHNAHDPPPLTWADRIGRLSHMLGIGGGDVEAE